ncbi:hypothetical protein PYH68_05580 [Staphylococcus xylosus]|uniref:hypothetical protein n=1 Tax=Staphylococcus xylosus TaxID=1288 RepID=UPI003364D993
MKIKTKKQLNLPQLIEWAWEYGLKEITFYSINDDRGVAYEVSFAEDGSFYSPDEIKPEIIFTVEFEEEITEDTEISKLIKIDDDDTMTEYFSKSINEIKNPNTKSVYGFIYREPELIWKNGELVE